MQPFPFLFVPDLVADGAVVIGIHDGNFHCSAGDIQAVAGRDVEQIPVLLLTIQQTAHINLPLALHQGQAEHAPWVSPLKRIKLRIKMQPKGEELKMHCSWLVNQLEVLFIPGKE